MTRVAIHDARAGPVTRSARTLLPWPAAIALLTALALLTIPAAPAAAHHVARFSDARGDANGINDQLEGFCCDVSTPAASQPQADIVATSIRTLYRDRKPVRPSFASRWPAPSAAGLRL